MFWGGGGGGGAARATELRKHEANDGKCRELGWVCVPMVVEANRAWGAEAMASRLATSSNKAKAAGQQLSSIACMAA